MALSFSRFRLWVVAFLLVVIRPSFGLAASGDDSESLYRTGANEVQLTFSVTDQNGRGLATLQATDFAVVDTEHIVRRFRSFQRTDFTRLDVAVLLDTSDSVSPFLWPKVERAVQLISQMQEVPEESFSVVSFRGVEPAIVCAGNCRVAHVAERLAGMHAGGLTPLFDTVLFSSDFLARRSDQRVRRILILFSDGEDTISLHTFADALEAARAAEVQIYAVDCGEPTHSSGAEVLRALGDAAGGRYFTVEQAATLLVNAVLQDSRATYTVTYDLPSHATGFHPVRIVPTNSLHRQFRCRNGYYYPKTPAILRQTRQ